MPCVRARPCRPRQAIQVSAVQRVRPLPIFTKAAGWLCCVCLSACLPVPRGWRCVQRCALTYRACAKCFEDASVVLHLVLHAILPHTHQVVHCCRTSLCLVGASMLNSACVLNPCACVVCVCAPLAALVCAGVYMAVPPKALSYGTSAWACTL